MRPQDRVLARRQLDKRFVSLRDSRVWARPPRGWVKAIREALGMTTRQLGKRLGVSQPRVTEIEKAEVSGSITLGSLQRVANALDCQLIYAFVPRDPLESLVEQRAEDLALRHLKSTSHSMALEAQSVDPDEAREQLKQLVQELVEQSGSVLWEDE